MNTTPTRRDYSAELLARIDEALIGKSPAERRRILGAQQEKWIANFTRWQVLVESQNERELARWGDTCATDFSLTLAGIGQRIAREMEAA